MNPSPTLSQRVGTALASPFGTSMTWAQLAAVIVFVSIVLIAWRQVVLFIGQEIT